MLVLASIAFGVAAQNLSATLAPTSATCGPLLEKAQFEASGGSVLVEYTSATDQGGSPAGTKFGCDTLLDFAGASSALCYWIDARRVSAAVSESVELVPGKNITQRAGLLCPAESEPCNDCLAPASTTVVLASEAPAELSVVLQAPATVAAGQGLNVSARQSTGLGGRDPQAYEWSVDNQTVETTTWYELSLNSSDLEQWSSTTVRASLRVKNFLGVEATEWIDIELSETRELPYVYVRGPRRRKVSRWREIELNARGAATSCTNRSQIERGIDYEFHFFRVVGDSLEATPELENTARDPRAFILPAYSLEVNETYSLVATAIDRNLTISNSATATLFVEPSDSVVAVIEGGNRTVARSAEPTVTLSGASSFDPDVEDLLGAEAGLVFDWSCEAPPNVAAPRSVVGCAASLESDGAYLTLDPLSFNATTYTFVLRVTDSNNAREATATATLDFVDAEVASPVLSLEPRTSSALAGQRVSVRGVVTDNGGGASKINASWSIDDDSELKNDVSFREAALTALEVTSSSFGGTTNRTVSLVLAPNTLVPRATYRFRLSAISVEAVDDASRYHSEATVDVVVAAPPDAGRLDVSPNVGFAVTTEFELEARAFATSEPPLRFRFETRDGGSLLKVLQTATPEPRSPAFLAEADPAELACVAVDALGATAEASANATVLPYAGGAIEVDASNSIQVAETFYDKDAVCQQAIATATASDGAEVRNLLVAALIEIWEVYDFFNDQLAAYASALRAPMDTPEDLSVDISASSLQQARDVIFRLSTLGVDSELDDLSATDLSFVFSNILNTALFTNASEYDNLEDTVVTDRLDVDSNYEPKNATAILSEAVDLIAAARLRDRASGEDADLITTPNLRIATRRSSADEPATLDLFSGGGGEATTRRRFLNEKEAPSASTTTTGRVLVPAMTEPADLALSEFGTNPHRLEPNGEPLVGSVMRFEWTSVEETETISSSENATSSVVIVVPANRTTIVENERANVTLVCPWNYLGTVTALCPLDNSTVVFNCNKTRDYQEITVGCGNASSRACVNWRSGSQQWVQESCVRDASRSTDEEDYCVCDVIRDSPAVDYSTTERIEAYAKSVLREFAGSGFNLRRSRVMIIFLCVFVGLSALLVIFGRAVDSKDQKKFGAPPEEAVLDHYAIVGARPPPQCENKTGEMLEIEADVVRPHESQSSSSAVRISRSERLREQARVLLRRLVISDVPNADRPWWRRFLMVLWDQHPFCSAFRRDIVRLRSLRAFALSVECILLMTAVALEQRFEYPNPGCNKRKSLERCHKFKNISGRKMCKWSQDSGDCAYRGPPADNFYTIEHFAVVFIATMIVVPCVILFEWACIGVLARASATHHLGCSAFCCMASIETSGGGPAAADDSRSACPTEETTTINGIVNNARESKTSDATAIRKKNVKHDVIIRNPKFGRRQSLPEIDREDGVSVLRTIPDEPLSKTQPLKRRLRHFRTLGAGSDDVSLLAEARALAPDVSLAVLARRDELRAAMRRAHALSNPRGRRMSFILCRLEEDLAARWGIVPDNNVFLDHVSLIVFKHLRVARLWRQQLEQIPDKELRALWVANKAQLRRHLRASERRVYEQAYLRELATTRVFTEPSRMMFFVALGVTLAAVALPILYLASFASNVGRRGTHAFFVDFAFEAILFFGIVIPISVVCQFALFPSLVVQKIEHLATIPEDTTTQFPYSTPLNEDALDYLLDELPALSESLLGLGWTPGRNDLATRSSRPPLYNSDVDDDDDMSLISRSTFAQPSSVGVRRDVSFEQLEEIYGRLSWRPLWTTSCALRCVIGYISLPPLLQELAVQESALAIPLVAFAAIKVTSERDEPNAFYVIVGALVITWGGLFTCGYIFETLHRCAHRRRKVCQEHITQSLARNFAADASPAT